MMSAIPAPIAISLLVFAFALATSAESQDDPPPPMLAPVIVEEPRLEPERDLDADEALEEIRRTPGGVSLVPEERIDRTRASSLEDVLVTVPGVYVRSRGTGEEPQISIRGSGLRNNFHIRGVNILIDGFPFQNADGFSQVEAFEFLAARRVEVYKGANSVRFGGNTLGGAINIVTQTGRNAPPLRARTEGGDFGFWKTYASAATEGEPWDGFVAASHTQQEGYRDQSEQDRQRGYLSLGREWESGASLRFDGIAVRNRREIPGSLTRAEFHADPSQASPSSVAQDTARDFDYGRGAWTLSIPVSDDVRIAWQTQASYEDLYHPLAFGIIDNETFNVGSELRSIAVHEVLGWGGRLDLGLQGAYTRQPQRILANNGGSAGSSFARTLNEAANLSAFFSEELALTERFTVVAGSRFEWAYREIQDRLAGGSDSTDSFSAAPSLGGTWRLAETVEAYGNVGVAIEPGLLFELAAPGNLAGDLDDLDPQRSLQFELGARGSHFDEHIVFDVAVFDIELEDEVRNVNVDPTGQGFFTIPRYENIDRSRHWGVETGIDGVLARDVAALFGGEDGGALRLETSYTYSRFQYVDDDQFGDNELPGAPRHFVTATLRWEHEFGFWLAPQLLWVPDRWYVDSANQNSAPSYHLWSVRAGYDHRASGLSFFVEGRNLEDRDHVSAVTVDAADGRFYQPGDGRGVFGGVEWRWR
jgi:iron complex outermembrane receptor protein